MSVEIIVQMKVLSSQAVNQLSRAVGKEEDAKKRRNKAAKAGNPPEPESPENQAAVVACNSAMQSAKDACR